MLSVGECGHQVPSPFGPLRDRGRSAHQQGIVVRGPPISAHNVLIVNAKMIPTEAVVILRSDNIAKTDPPKQRVASPASDIDADAVDRIEIGKAHDILARLAIDPREPRRGREPADNIAHSLRGGMQGDRRHHRAQCQQHEPRAAAAEIGIEFHRARHDRRCDDATAAMADDRQLIDLVCPRGGDDALRSGIDGTIEPSSTGYGQTAGGPSKNC